MNKTPPITIYVRHSVGCKYEGDEFAKRCDCRKWLRWTVPGMPRERRPANTRSWQEAERLKTELANQLSGNTAPAKPASGKNIRSAIEVFVAEKKVENLSTDVIKKYERALGRLASFCEARMVFSLDGIDRELITGFCGNWNELYPSGNTRNKLRERYKSFMRYCVDAKWLGSVPKWPKMPTEEAPTLPLDDDEYARLLDSVYVVVRAPENVEVENQGYEYWCKRVRGLFLLMRWSGLAIQDALTLPRTRLVKDETGYRVKTARTKTGTWVSVRVPDEIAEELIAIPNGNPEFFFWSGAGKPKSICGNWGKRFIVPCFNEAKIESEGYMKSHRLRDTFACDLLTKGVSLDHVSKLLGHKSVRTTEKSYSAWVKARQDALDVAVVSAWAPPAPKKRGGRKRAA